MGFILGILALVLFIIVFIFVYIFNLIYDTKDKKWFKLASKRNRDMAMDVDITANFIFSVFWNVTLSKSGDNYKFGRIGETLSSVLGKKLGDKSLNSIGLTLAYTINIIDFTNWFKGGHCKYAIQTEEEIEKFLTND